MFTLQDALPFLIFFGVLLVLARGLGSFICKALTGEKNILTPLLLPIEKWIYRFCGISVRDEQTWQEYAGNVLIFSMIGILVLIALLLCQSFLPLNPQKLSALSWPLAFNIATSFVTNTNWQSYAGESTLSYLVQMLGLTVQNFLSAGTGIAVLFALMRGMIRQSSKTLGSFWVDLVRIHLYVLIPLSVIFALILVQQGVIQNFQPYQQIKTLEGHSQILPLGPVASQIAIKQLGTNGGGFFNANSAHPFENPTPLTNFLEALALLLLPAALVFSFGKMMGSAQEGRMILGVMGVLFLAGLALSLFAEFQPNPFLKVSTAWEGKETRIGIPGSVLWSVATTAASNGSVNAMHSSLSPLSGAVTLFNIMLGEIIFGGVGSGLYGMLLLLMLSIFIAGLMVGRTPEYLGKKIEIGEMKWVILGILIPNILILAGTSISLLVPEALSSLAHKGTHGFSEMLYAFSSAAGNNGSAFAGLNANTLYFNLILGVVMLLGRFGVLLPVLGIAGSLALKQKLPPTSGTLPTQHFLFGFLLTLMILLVAALTFLPALFLGPVLEHLLMLAERGI